MRGAEIVNDEFEVGFDRTFECRWYRAEQAGRVVIMIVVAGAALGLLGRGPFSHETKAAPRGAISVDYEPVARHRRRMRRLRLTQHDIMAAARQRGLMRLEQVRYAVAERDGKISIVEDRA